MPLSQVVQILKGHANIDKQKVIGWTLLRIFLGYARRHQLLACRVSVTYTQRLQVLQTADLCEVWTQGEFGYRGCRSWWHTQGTCSQSTNGLSNLESLRPVTPALHRPTHQSKPKNRALSTHRVIQDIRVMVESDLVAHACFHGVSTRGGESCHSRHTGCVGKPCVSVPFLDLRVNFGLCVFRRGWLVIFPPADAGSETSIKVNLLDSPTVYYLNCPTAELYLQVSGWWCERDHNPTCLTEAQVQDSESRIMWNKCVNEPKNSTTTGLSSPLHKQHLTTLFATSTPCCDTLSVWLKHAGCGWHTSGINWVFIHIRVKDNSSSIN